MQRIKIRLILLSPLLATGLRGTSALAQIDAILPPIGGRGGGQFVGRCPQGQFLTGFELRTGDDIDSIRPICVVAYGPAKTGPPNKFAEAYGGPEFPSLLPQLRSLPPHPLVCPDEAPIVTGMYVRSEGQATEVVNNLHLFCGVAAAVQAPSDFPAAVFDGPYSTDRSEGTQHCPSSLVAVGVNGRSGQWLDAVGLICGTPKLTPLPSPGGILATLGRSIGANDFNDDGHGDILWHNASTGESQIWFMNGSSRISRSTILDGARPAMVGPPWSIAGTRDFTGDRLADLLWYNSATGQLQIWFMNRQRLTGRATVLGENGKAATVGPPWSIVAVNDMNRDTKPDIIWHNSSTGETQIWQMNGYRVVSRLTVLGENGSAAYVGLPWSIVGSGDFDGNGRTDLLWHNGSTGESQIWQMNGYRVTGRETVLGEDGSPALVGAPWAIAGTNNFNQDLAADILWHNDTTGETQIWFMKGRSVVRRATVEADRDGGVALVGQPWSIK